MASRGLGGKIAPRNATLPGGGAPGAALAKKTAGARL